LEARDHGGLSLFSNRSAIMNTIPTNATTMDFTFVVQKTRSVEFLVKPPKPE
jgi:hypothetical protein